MNQWVNRVNGILWVDKYRVKDLEKLDYHKEQAEGLRLLMKQGDFPHLLFHGPLGAGKKTRIMCLLKEFYGAEVERLRYEHMNFTTPSNKKLEIMTVSSNYHIEVTPSDVGVYDRIVIMDLIKNVVQNQQLDANGQRELKVIILNGVEYLTQDAQNALRRTMEKYTETCRLILCANSISRLIPAIRSRCLQVRIAAPTHQEIVSILQDICQKEGLPLPIVLAQRIAEASDRNLRRAILMCQACKMEHVSFFHPKQIPDVPTWLRYIRDIANRLIEGKSMNAIVKGRRDLYELIVHGIPSELIFKELVRTFTAQTEVEQISFKIQVVALAAKYEHRMQHGNRKIFHLEAFLVEFLSLFSKFLPNVTFDLCRRPSTDSELEVEQ